MRGAAGPGVGGCAVGPRMVHVKWATSDGSGPGQLDRSGRWASRWWVSMPCAHCQLQPALSSPSTTVPRRRPAHPCTCPGLLTTTTEGMPGRGGARSAGVRGWASRTLRTERGTRMHPRAAMRAGMPGRGHTRAQHGMARGPLLSSSMSRARAAEAGTQGWSSADPRATLAAVSCGRRAQSV